MDDNKSITPTSPESPESAGLNAFDGIEAAKESIKDIGAAALDGQDSGTDIIDDTAGGPVDGRRNNGGGGRQIAPDEFIARAKKDGRYDAPVGKGKSRSVLTEAERIRIITLYEAGNTFEAIRQALYAEFPRLHRGHAGRKWIVKLGRAINGTIAQAKRFRGYVGTNSDNKRLKVYADIERERREGKTNDVDYVDNCVNNSVDNVGKREKVGVKEGSISRLKDETAENLALNSRQIGLIITAGLKNLKKQRDFTPSDIQRLVLAQGIILDKMQAIEKDKVNKADLRTKEQLVDRFNQILSIISKTREPKSRYFTGELLDTSHNGSYVNYKRGDSTETTAPALLDDPSLSVGENKRGVS